MGSFGTIGPKIAVIDSEPDGATYGNDMRAVLRMLQALVQPNVINMTTADPPDAPNSGDTYVVAAAPTGVWVGQANSIAYWSVDNPNVPTGEWEFYTPLQGWLVLNRFDGAIYVFNGAEWVKFSTSTGGGALGKWPGNWLGCNAAGVSHFSSGLNGGANIGMSCVFFNQAIIDGGSSYEPSATEPVQIGVQGASLSQQGGIADQALNITLGILQDWFLKAAIIGLTSSRYWIGISDQTPGEIPTVFNSDTPAANFVGFRFASDVDTTIKAVCQTGSGAQTVVDTTIAPGTPQTFEIVPTGSGITFYINGTLVATIDTNVPASSLPLSSFIGLDAYNDGASDFQFNFYYVYALVNS
jgi:hypothetical protein